MLSLGEFLLHGNDTIEGFSTDNGLGNGHAVEGAGFVFQTLLGFLLFRFLILKRNYATPGRETGDGDVKLYTRADYNAKAQKNISEKKVTTEKGRDVSALILEGLGGKDNIISLDCCATRLRVSVAKPELVDENRLKESGAKGVIKKGIGVQVVYGPQVSVIKSELEDYIGNLG
jgi:glucose-like phosphotransferase system IIB component